MPNQTGLQIGFDAQAPNMHLCFHTLKKEVYDIC